MIDEHRGKQFIGGWVIWSIRVFSLILICLGNIFVVLLKLSYRQATRSCTNISIEHKWYNNVYVSYGRHQSRSYQLITNRDTTQTNPHLHFLHLHCLFHCYSYLHTLPSSIPSSSTSEYTYWIFLVLSNPGFYSFPLWNVWIINE